MHTALRLACACALPFTAAAAADAQCQIQKLVPPDAILQQQTGEAVAIDGGIAVLGAPFDDDGGTWTGSAYVYELVGGQWVETAKLHASDAAADDRFGFAVAIDQGVIVVGTRYKQDMGYGTGAAYVYEKVGGVWTETGKLLAHDAVNDQFFGNSVAVSGDTIVVGAYLDDELGYAAGAAYVFERSGSSWVETQRLIASDGVQDDRFGWDVAAGEDLLFIGAHGCDVSGQKSGAVYVFEREEGPWLEHQKLVPSDPKEGVRFGYSVDIAGIWAIVGCPFDDAGGFGAGAAYIWVHKGNKWLQHQKITAPDALPDDLFGEQVALKDSLAIASAWGVDGAGLNSGAAYLFRNTGAIWADKARLAPSDVAEFDNFSKALDLSGDAVLVGSSQDDDIDDRVGAAYVFSANGLDCPTLYAEPETIRLVLGGTQYFTLRPPGAVPGNHYFLLGSLSGTSPGFSIGSFQVPLNPDPYFNVTLLYPNLPPLSTSFAPLDAAGQGAARFTLPATRDPALGGLTVSHAYGVLDATTFDLLFVSPPSHLAFL